MFLLIFLALLFPVSLQAMDGAPPGQQMNEEEPSLENDLWEGCCYIAQWNCLDGHLRTYIRNKLEIEEKANSADRVERHWGQLEQMAWNICEVTGGFLCSYLLKNCLSSSSPEVGCMCASCCGGGLYEKYRRILSEEAEKIE